MADFAEFYLEDLKTKFAKIDPKKYYLSYSGGKGVRAESALHELFHKRRKIHTDSRFNRRCGKRNLPKISYRDSENLSVY